MFTESQTEPAPVDLDPPTWKVTAHVESPRRDHEWLLSRSVPDGPGHPAAIAHALLDCIVGVAVTHDAETIRQLDAILRRRLGSAPAPAPPLERTAYLDHGERLTLAGLRAAEQHAQRHHGVPLEAVVVPAWDGPIPLGLVQALLAAVGAWGDEPQGRE